MNVLFLCHRLPFPPDKGDKIRAHHILSHLLRDHTVYLGTFIDDANDQRYLEAVRQRLNDRCLIISLSSLNKKFGMIRGLMNNQPLSTACFYSSKLKAWITDLIEARSIDRVVLFGSTMAPYLLDTSFASSRVILDMVDIDSDKWAQYGRSSSWPLSSLYAREAKTLLALERKASRQFAATLLVSPAEVREFSALAPETVGKVHVVQNGVDAEYFSPARPYQNPFSDSEFPIVMTGRMDYRPNVDGAVWFSQHVLPKVRHVLPNARFYIVGARPAKKLDAIRSASTIVTGQVADIRPYLAHAAVVVAPLLMARGVQNKVLEAMAMRKQVVATTPATRALSVKTGQELWIQDDPADFAAAIIESITGKKSADMANCARKYVEEQYNWERNLGFIDGLLKTDTLPLSFGGFSGATNPFRNKSSLIGVGDICE